MPFLPGSTEWHERHWKKAAGGSLAVATVALGAAGVSLAVVSAGSSCF
jgi:hypothetical protein